MPRRPARPATEQAAALLAALVKVGALVEVGGVTVPAGVLTGARVVAGAVELAKAGVETGLWKKNVSETSS
jgi:hypothetical protein